MRNLIIKILIISLAAGLSSRALSSVPSQAKSVIFGKHSDSGSDTVYLNGYIRLAYAHLTNVYQSSLSSKSKDHEVELLKSYIDTLN